MGAPSPLPSPKKHQYRHLARLHDIENPLPLRHHHHVGRRRDRRATAPSPDRHYGEHPPSFRRLCCICFLWSLLAAVLLFTLLVLAVLFLYLSYLPILPQFRLEHLGLSRDSLSSGRLEASVDISIAAANDNGLMRFGLEELQVRVYSDGGIELGNSTVPGTFELSEKSASVVQAEVRVVSKYVVPDLVRAEELPRRIKDDRLVAAVHWGVAVKVAVKNWSLGKYRVRVACENIDMLWLKKKEEEVENAEQPICPIFLFGWIPLSRYLP